MNGHIVAARPISLDDLANFKMFRKQLGGTPRVRDGRGRRETTPFEDSERATRQKVICGASLDDSL